jgi:hypothetical protein
LLQALGPAQMPASYTVGGEAWIPLIGSPGNMQVSGSKGQHQLAVEVAEALWRRDSALSSLAADCRGKGASSVKTSPFLFLGGSRGMFSLKAGPKKETATRASCPQEEAAKREGGREPSLPSPLPWWFSRLVAGGAA